MRTRTMSAILMLAAAGVSLGGSPQTPPPTQAPGTMVQIVEVSAERFSFTPSEIKTLLGTALEIRLRSDDTDHGFRIVGTDVNLTIPKRGRGIATVTFTPPSAGRYTFECSQICGAGHSFMRGQIVVVDGSRDGSEEE